MSIVPISYTAQAVQILDVTTVPRMHSLNDSAQKNAEQLLHFVEALEPRLNLPEFQGNAIDQAQQLREWMQAEGRVQIEQVTSITLFDAQLQSLPSEIGLFSHVERLAIVGNWLQELPSEIANLQSLVEVDLQNNLFNTFPMVLTGLPNLQSLNIADNDLDHLPPEIAQLERLVTLDLSLNCICAIPPEMGKLQQLMELNLSNNHLSNIPDSLKNCQSLINLNLANNGLSLFPSGIAELWQLQKLNIANNYFAEELPARLHSVYVIADPTLEEQIRTWETEYEKAFTDQPLSSKSQDHWYREAMLAFFPKHPRTLELMNTTPIKEARSPRFDAKKKDSNDPLLHLPRDEHEILRTYLQRLRSVKDYAQPSTLNAQNGIRLRVHCMLHVARMNLVFRQQMLDLMMQALNNCDDRILLFFNDIEVLEHFYARHLSDRELQSLSALAGRYIVVKECAKQLVKTYRLEDEVETILYLQIALREELHLPITTTGMLYPEQAGITQERLQKVFEQVHQRTFNQLLATSECWLERMEQEYPDQVQMIHAKYDKLEQYAEDYYQLKMTEEKANWIHQHQQESQEESETCQFVMNHPHFDDAYCAIHAQKKQLIAELYKNKIAETHRRRNSSSPPGSPAFAPSERKEY